MLLRAGGLNALQNVLIIAALPFSILLVLVTISLIKELNYERHQMGLYLKPHRYPEKGSPFRSYESDDYVGGDAPAEEGASDSEEEYETDDDSDE